MVVALGADLDPAATPGLVEAGGEFYTVDGAFAGRDVLSSFGGGRVIVGVTSTPFKCPPAPSEVTFRSGERPNGQFDEPSDLLLADKAEFGTSRIRRWFGRDWTSY